MTNFTNVTNNFDGVNTLKGLLNIPNLNTGGYAWIGLLIMVQGILLFSFLRFGFLSALLSSAFVSLIAGLFLVYLGLIGWHWLMFFVGQIILIILYITWQERNNI